MTSITQKYNHTYDTANRLTSINGQAVQWDDNGNMLADGQAVYKYNAANKLVGVTKGTSNIIYAYSGLGDRLRQVADGVTTDYTLDINAGLTQVLQDGKQTYLYGNARIAQIAETQTGYFLPDALGSMRQMTDPSADLTLAKSYAPYGNVVSSSGAGETVYGYTGEMQSGGLVHLRARDYASQLGRFTSRDTWEGYIKRPLSLNKWNYVDSSPINLVDPTGNDPCNVDDPNDYRCHPTPTPNLTPTPVSNKTAYLTFDDGPDPSATPQIAIYLYQHYARATFFVSGTTDGKLQRIPFGCIPDFNGSDNVPLDDFINAPVINIISVAGHSIGIHGWNHDFYWDNQSDGGKNEVDQVNQALLQAIPNIALPKLLRAPGGHFPSKPIEGYENWFYYGWDVAPDMNAGSNNPGDIIKYLEDELENQGYPDNPIILLHSIKWETNEAITNSDYDMISHLKKIGYTKFEALPRPGDNPGYPWIGKIPSQKQ